MTPSGKKELALSDSSIRPRLTWQVDDCVSTYVV